MRWISGRKNANAPSLSLIFSDLLFKHNFLQFPSCGIGRWIFCWISRWNFWDFSTCCIFQIWSLVNFISPNLVTIFLSVSRGPSTRRASSKKSGPRLPVPVIFSPFLWRRKQVFPFLHFAQTCFFPGQKLPSVYMGTTFLRNVFLLWRVFPHLFVCFALHSLSAAPLW